MTFFSGFSHSLKIRFLSGTKIQSRWPERLASQWVSITQRTLRWKKGHLTKSSHCSRSRPLMHWLWSAPREARERHVFSMRSAGQLLSKLLGWKKRDGPPKWPHWITLSHIHWWKYGTMYIEYAECIWDGLRPLYSTAGCTGNCLRGIVWGVWPATILVHFVPISQLYEPEPPIPFRPFPRCSMYSFALARSYHHWWICIKIWPSYLGKAEGVSLGRYNDKSVLENLHCSTLFEARIASPNRCLAEFVPYSWYIWLYTVYTYLNNSKYMSLRMCVYDIIYILVYYVQYIYNSVYIYTHMWIFYSYTMCCI